MSITKKIFYLLSAMLSILALPWLGSYIHHGGKFPDGFFSYPPIAPIPKADPFNIYVFGFFVICFIGVVCLYIFPQWFGFKKAPEVPARKIKKVGFPIWFWVGLIGWGVSLFLLMTRAIKPVWLLHWSDVPLFWGLALMIDGWVYIRNGGKSLISEVPQEVIGIGVASVSGWMYFEFLNFFVDDDWYYPRGNIISREQFLLEACIISSGLMPVAFEWYTLFKTFPALSNRFDNGFKIICPEWLKTVALVVSLGGLLCAGLFPNLFFFSLWLTPPLLLVVVLDMLGIWTPVRAIGQGNWTPSLLFALTYFAEGLCLEGQNYLSAIHNDQVNIWTQAPLYWQYSLPYVDKFKLFEMPILGFLGYLPFGLYCWFWWIAFATLTGVPSKFYKEEPFEAQTAD